MIYVAIVEEDEKYAKKLQELIKELNEETVFYLYSKGEELQQFLGTGGKIDLFLLDRRPSDIDGYVLASEIRETNEYLFTPIIFLLEYEKNQKDLFFEYHCFAYILKSIDQKFLQKQLTGILKQLGFKEKKPIKKAVYLKGNNIDTIVPVEQILYLEKVGRDCCVHTVGKKYLIPRKSLEKILQEIDDYFIVRCHKSFAVNLSNVVQIRKKYRNIWDLVFKEDKALKCEVSGTYYGSVLKRFYQLDQEKEII